jgi:hypothetical protein
MAEHALPGDIVMAQRLVQPMADLAGDHGHCDEPGMWMPQAGAGIGPLVLEYGDVVDTGVDAQLVVALFVYAANCELCIREQRHVAGVVRTVADDFVKSEAIDAAPPGLQATRGLDVAGQRGKFVRNDSHGPRLARARRKPHDFGRRPLFVAGTERTGFEKGWHGLFRTMRRQFFGMPGPLGSDDDPLLGKEILSQFGHGAHPRSPSAAGLRYRSDERASSRPAQR